MKIITLALALSLAATFLHADSSTFVTVPLDSLSSKEIGKTVMIFESSDGDSFISPGPPKTMRVEQKDGSVVYKGRLDAVEKEYLVLSAPLSESTPKGESYSVTITKQKNITEIRLGLPEK
jgi:hypothetical protein